MHSEVMRYRRRQGLSEHSGEEGYVTLHVSLVFKKRVGGQKYNICKMSSP